jgi:hypothetical protein
MYSSNDAGLYVIKSIAHDIKELYEKAMTRKDFEEGCWSSYGNNPNNLNRKRPSRHGRRPLHEYGREPGYLGDTGLQKGERLQI